MMSNHTQGEWKFEVQESQIIIYSEGHGGVTAIPLQSNGKPLTHLRPEFTANAKLIVAAPKMLEVLVFAKQAFEQYKNAHGTEKCEAYFRMEQLILTL